MSVWFPSLGRPAILAHFLTDDVTQVKEHREVQISHASAAIIAAFKMVENEGIHVGIDSGRCLITWVSSSCGKRAEFNGATLAVAARLMGVCRKEARFGNLLVSENTKEGTAFPLLFVNTSDILTQVSF